MIFRRSIVTELTSTASAVFTVLFSILFSVGLVRILGQAAGGRVDNQAVFQLLALTSLTWLPVVLTLTLFISILMALSRAYRDSEMVVWFASGQSLLAWLTPVLRFSWPIFIAVGLLAMFVTPWSLGQIDELRQSFSRRDDVSRVAPGRFIESGGADRVFFVESVNFEDSQVRNVFVSMRSQGREGVIVAAKGEIEVAPNGDRYLVLENGRRYEGRPGSAEYRTMEFDRYSIRLEARPDRPLSERNARTKTAAELWAEPTSFARGEFMWRIGMPIAAFIVTLLAIPLAYTNPRVGRSFNLIIAVLVFAIYMNMLSTVQGWVAQERLSFGIGVWVVHAVVLLLVVALFARRVYLQRWWPKRLTLAYWRREVKARRVLEAGAGRP
ncbi:MAG TPA: LPS export ABC transporter permease LptF [Burkholderiaceae bacterium]|nr:LPS export ABC transporter permease LptF [Burkholderiaceae bacterium]